MSILKYLLLCITLLFFITMGAHADYSDKKKSHDKDVKKYHEKKFGKKGMWKQCPTKNMYGQCPMMGMGSPPMMVKEEPFTMIEAQGRLFLFNKKTGDVWVCNAFKKICEQMIIKNIDTD